MGSWKYNRDVDAVREQGKKVWHILKDVLDETDGDLDIVTTQCGCFLHAKNLKNKIKEIERKTLPAHVFHNICSFCAKDKPHPWYERESRRD